MKPLLLETKVLHSYSLWSFSRFFSPRKRERDVRCEKYQLCEKQWLLLGRCWSVAAVKRGIFVRQHYQNCSTLLVWVYLSRCWVWNSRKRNSPQNSQTLIIIRQPDALQHIADSVIWTAMSSFFMSMQIERMAHKKQPQLGMHVGRREKWVPVEQSDSVDCHRGHCHLIQLPV